MKLKLNIRIAAVIFFFLSILSPLTTFGANLKDAFGDTANTKSGLTPLDQVADKSGYNVYPDNPGIDPIISTIIQTALSLIGVIFLLLVIYGGYNWMTAAGDNSKVETAKNTITRAVIGLVVVLAAYAISYFVIQSLGANTLNDATFK